MSTPRHRHRRVYTTVLWCRHDGIVVCLHHDAGNAFNMSVDCVWSGYVDKNMSFLHITISLVAWLLVKTVEFVVDSVSMCSDDDVSDTWIYLLLLNCGQQLARLLLHCVTVAVDVRRACRLVHTWVSLFDGLYFLFCDWERNECVSLLLLVPSRSDCVITTRWTHE